MKEGRHMKKIIILACLCLFALSGCRFLTARGRSVNRAEKLIEQGDFYQGSLVLSDVLIKNSLYEPALELFPTTFQNALTQNLEEAEEYSQKNVHKEYAYTCERILELYKALSRIPQESLNNMNMEKDFESLREWTKKTAEAFYTSAEKSYPNAETLDQYKEKAVLYKKSFLTLPSYKDSKENYDKYRELAMRKIVYYKQNYLYGYMDISESITDKMVNTMESKGDFIEYAQIKDGISTGLQMDNKSLAADFNRLIEVEVVNFDYDYPSSSERRYTEYYYEKITTKNNITTSEIMDYRPSASEEGVSYIKHKYTKIKNVETTRAFVTIKYSIYDLTTDKLIREGRINKEVIDSETWYTYHGHPTKIDDFDFGVKDKFILIDELCAEAGTALGEEIMEHI